MSDEPKAQGWFHTLPGIITSTAAILTAVTGLVVALKPSDTPQPSPAASISPSPAASISPSSAASTQTVQSPIPQSSTVEQTTDTPSQGKGKGRNKDKDK